MSGFPVFVVAGLETQAIRAQWFSQMASHLIFGLPATAALIAIVLLALKRTRRFYEEATRRQVAENALKQSQRLEALGQLTGGVAHDFNNLLMVVEGSAQRLKRRHHDPADLRSLDMIESAVRKGSSLTRQLLSFARRQSLSPKVVDLVDCIEKFREILRQSVPGDIEIELKVPQQEIPVKIDPDEFEIALLNLTLNARDAMPDGGRITISVRTAELDENSARQRADGQGCRDCVFGYRLRYCGRHPRPHLRAVLHHQEGRSRHRAWTEPGLRICAAIERRDHRHQPSRHRHDIRVVPALLR